ncbi:MAG TPA: hypothetical protein VF650_10435 [Allosphingosinicella sp.]
MTGGRARLDYAAVPRRLPVLLALLGASSAAGAREAWTPPPGFETVETVEALAAHHVGAEPTRPPGKPILRRAVTLAGGATLQPGPAEKAFRERFGLGGDAQLLLSRWIRFGENGAREVIGYAYCTVRLKLGVGQVIDCFRDSDGDGRLDGALNYAPTRRQEPKLQFAPMAPVSYVRWVAPNGPTAAVRRGEGEVRVEYEPDPATGRLLFHIRSIQAFGRAEERLEPALAVDAASLPTTISIAGAQLRLLAWDGKRLSVSVGAVEPAVAVMVEPPPPGSGKKGAYRLSLVPSPR